MKKLIEASTQRTHIITKADLPLCCPMPNEVLWNSHPRVYLPIEATGEFPCPYCGVHYFLEKESAES
jgi:uncharacterized Zn-finger protein